MPPKKKKKKEEKENPAAMMAEEDNKESNISVSQDRFTCAICLRLLKDPSTIPCGHNYCLGCITACWDQEDRPSQGYRCPQCRMTFTPRPVVCRNPLLAEMVEKLRATGSGGSEETPRQRVPPGEVECTACIGRKRKADKSCLDCLASYCEAHYNRHEELHSGKRHKVVEAVGQLEDMICSKHNKPLEVWCRTDQVCVCPLCIIDDHKGHDIITAAAAKTEKQRELSTSFKQQIKQREKELEQLRGAVEPFKDSVKASLDASDKTFKELITLLETKWSELKELIKAREQANLTEADQLEGRLENLLERLKQNDDELDQLFHTEDPIHFLLNLSSLCSQDLHMNFGSHTYFGMVEKLLSNLNQHVSECLQKDFNNITSQVEQVLIEDTTRRDMMQYFYRPEVDKDKKFIYHSSQVLCTKPTPWESKYWEVEWDSSSSVKIAVASEDIKRRSYGVEGEIGRNAKSWSLDCSSSGFKFSHDNKTIEINSPLTPRVGVYLDRPAQRIAFYGIYGRKATLLHRVTVHNTGCLYPAFNPSPEYNGKLKIC